jgi:hypothetical protein
VPMAQAKKTAVATTTAGVTATDVLELGTRQGADIEGVLCVAHFSLHARKSEGPFRSVTRMYV